MGSALVATLHGVVSAVFALACLALMMIVLSALLR
jgi:hypothetical protein